MRAAEVAADDVRLALAPVEEPASFCGELAWSRARLCMGRLTKKGIPWEVISGDFWWQGCEFMARTVEIDFTFEGAIDVSTALRTLLEAGMRPSVEGEVAYLIDEDGMFDWQRLGDDRLNEVIFKMGELRWRDRVVGITLFFPEVNSGGDFLFHPGRT